MLCNVFAFVVLVQIFAAEYFKHNEGGVIKSGDAAYVLAFAVMMLHTDLHNPAVRHHMTVQQWLSMNRGEIRPPMLLVVLGCNFMCIFLLGDEEGEKVIVRKQNDFK